MQNQCNLVHRSGWGMSEQIYVGIDGTGLKTVALAMNQWGMMVGRGASLGSNYHEVGIDVMRHSLQDVLDQVLRGRLPAAICFCLAGLDTAYDHARIDAVLRDMNLRCPYVIRNNVIGYFRAGSRFPYGVGVVCGPGFNAGGVSRDGQQKHLFAQGRFTGDLTSSVWLGHDVLTAAFRSWDGRGETTHLQDAVLKIFDVPDYEALAQLHINGAITWQNLPDLIDITFDLARDGDAVAVRIITEHATEIGVSAVAMLRRLDLLDVDCDVVLHGSVISGRGPLMMDTVRRVVSAAAPLAQLNILEVSPVIGAALMAMDVLTYVPGQPIPSIKPEIPEDFRLPGISY